jgi:LysR family transcriptional regulator, transcriptional activator of nhaA
VRHPNYNHLLYFWTTVREGGIGRAAESLHITPQTISGQIKLLERELDGPLLQKQGRRVVPTGFGQTVFEYADELFALGQDLVRVAQGSAPRERRSVTIGVSDVVPNLVTWRVIAPLMQGERPFRVVCHTGSLDILLAELASHKLDLVLSTSALPANAGLRAYSHFLGECEVAFFAATPLARRLRKGFPASLDDAPFLLPTNRSPNRRVLDTWFLQEGISPRIVGEFDDSALVKSFVQGGVGVFAAPAAIEREIVRQYRVQVVGRTGAMHARFYVLSMERRIRHPAVAAITERARAGLFSEAPGKPRRLRPRKASGPAAGGG